MRADLEVRTNWRDDTVDVSVRCIWCGQMAHVRDIPQQAFAAWYNGGVAIQDALPDLTPGQRETLISGSHEACFDEGHVEVAP